MSRSLIIIKRNHWLVLAILIFQFIRPVSAFSTPFDITNGNEGAFSPQFNMDLFLGTHNFTTVNIPFNVVVSVFPSGVMNILATDATINGSLDMSSGGYFSLNGSLTNKSTNTLYWNTNNATLAFAGSSGTIHNFSVAGQNGNGFLNNFSWNSLLVENGNILNLTNGSGNALYVDYLGLQGGVSQLSDLTATNGVTLYYNANDPLNAYLGDQVIALTGGGSLDPYNSPSGGVSATPEPPTVWLMATGLLGMFGWAGYRRIKVQA